MIRTYQELILLPTFEQRFNYLKLNGSIGTQTFGFDRYLNQMFYRSKEWKKIRNQVIVRDEGCDLALKDNEIFGRIYIHHMNPIQVKDILDQSDYLLNLDYLVCVSMDTHNAIHYGDYSLLLRGPIERTPNDTCPWKV